jgi:hypothetical protein
MPNLETEKTLENNEIPPVQPVHQVAPEVKAAKPVLEVEPEDGPEEEPEGEVDHPHDRLLEVVKIVKGQMKRLQKKQTHDLKAELTLNIYPIILNSLEAIVEYFDICDPENIDEEDEIEMDPEQAQQIAEFQKMAEEEGRKILETCELILAMDKALDTKTRSKMPEQYDRILIWAREKRDLAIGQVPDSVLNSSPEPEPVKE